MSWKVMFGTLFLLGVSVSISYSKTMFYTEIKASSVTNQSIYSLKELQNKKLAFLSRGDQSTGHFAIGFPDTLGQLVDYATYDSMHQVLLHIRFLYHRMQTTLSFLERLLEEI